MKGHMSFTAEDYREAAAEHVNVARELYDRKRYVLAHYISGLAVECIFRAYYARLNSIFDKRHDLVELAKAAKFYDLVPEKADEVRAALGVVVSQWVNSHRYRSEAALRRFLKEGKLDRGIKGNFVKENSRRIVIAASELVNLGVLRWQRQTN